MLELGGKYEPDEAHHPAAITPCCVLRPDRVATAERATQAELLRIDKVAVEGCGQRTPHAPSFVSQTQRAIRRTHDGLGHPAGMADLQSSLRAAEACLDAGQPKEALQHCKAALKADKQSVEALL